eukprot:CAMPEP_0197543214 /NCGR_PEP_ID=MMETSP1318-20131121/68120_1 /TAXON_ID=552666 /ORGANISM="Partenskyella glossopodia, Strain RCC365" /LENGTH=156 /DNA_ID=CAMNT_0043102533 /DNA_START=558 /DNA_END=1028 /DNA_ORIENTATION=-
MNRQTLLIASVALNALLVIALCSSVMTSKAQLASSAVRARTAAPRFASPVATPRMQQRSMRTFAQQQPNVEAMKRDFARTMGAAAVGYTTFMNTAPAQALVDERMNGDGAGLKLGINDSRLFFIIAGVFTTVWAVYSQSVKGISNNDDDDSGLGLS